MKASITKAQKQNKKIILVFQGSDWCGPCIKLSKEIWSTRRVYSLLQRKLYTTSS